MPTDIKLHYFHGRGIGEAIRLIFVVGDIRFEDCRYTIEEYRAASDLKSKFPFGQMPTLEIDGQFIGQTDSIARLAARIGGLYPADPVVAARSDMVVVHQAEIQKAIARLSFDGVPGAAETEMYPEEERKSRIAAWFESELPELMVRLEQHLTGPYYAGDEICWADIAVFVRLQQLLDVNPDLLVDSYPKLEALTTNLGNLPAIKHWIAEHPDDYPRFTA